jgi:multidrug efflux system outer membrane protein
MYRLWILLAFAALTFGCKLGPNYQRPDLDVPADYNTADAEGESFANLNWWEVFDDPQLVDLIELGLESNKELAIASARRDEVRARLGFARADLYPQLTAAADASTGNSNELFLPGSGVQDLYVIGADLSYEVDLFGKLRRATEAAKADLLASEAARQTVITAVVADLATAYFLLRDVDARYEIAQRTVKTRAESTAIIQARFNKGIVPILDVNQAQIEQADAEASLAAMERAQAQAANLISVLLGRNPGPVVRGRELSNQTLPPQIPAGLPAELLTRRPDVWSAEQDLAAQTARIGIAEALRWPSLSLTGALGLASPELSDLLDSNEIWDISGSLFAPLFNGGRNLRRVDIERARTEALLNRYELSVLIAFQEVEDALVATRTWGDEHAARLRQLEAARSATRLSRARYDGGVTSYLEVLDSERSLFDAENSASQTLRSQLVSVVDLYKALGGGWDPESLVDL